MLLPGTGLEDVAVPHMSSKVVERRLIYLTTVRSFHCSDRTVLPFMSLQS